MKTTFHFLTVKLSLALALDWIIIFLFFVSDTSTSNWEIKSDVGEPSQSLLRQNVPNEDSIKTFKDYSGIVPLVYDLTVKAPIDSNGVFRHIFEGSVLITFLCNRSTKYLYFHIKELSVNTSNVKLVEVNQFNSDIDITKVRIIDSDKLALELNSDLIPSKIYRLTFGKFTGPIKGPNSEGFFASETFNDASTKTYVYATQFQLNSARTVFPCVDLPQFKCNLTFKLEHPDKYISLSNGAEKKVDTITLVKKDGGTENLFLTDFETTPRLPTYTMGFTLLPKSVYDHLTKTNVKLADCWQLDMSDSDGQKDQTISLSIYYNRYQITPNHASLLLKYAEYAYCYFDRQWRVTLPLKKLDLVIIPQFIVYGMENYGLIILSEEFLLKSTDDTQFSLIAHEIAHQWLSNLVTIQSWTYLCFQEGLTEHYARRVIRDYYLSQNNNLSWLKHLTSRYLPAMKEETDDDSITPLIQSNFQSVTQVALWCFNRAPFVISSLELLTGTVLFDTKVSEFIRRYQYGNYVFDDFTKFFDTVILDNRRVSQYLRFSFEHGGYPSLFVSRIYDGTKRITLIRKQIVTKKNWTYESVTVEWPMPVSCLTSSGILPAYCNLKIYDTDNLTLNTDLDDSSWIVFNDEFKFFYRVNYDMQNWRLLSIELTSPECRLNLLTQIQLVNDFCFFKKLRLFQTTVDDELTKENFKNAYYQLQNKTGVHLEFYIAECIN